MTEVKKRLGLRKLGWAEEARPKSVRGLLQQYLQQTRSQTTPIETFHEQGNSSKIDQEVRSATRENF